MEVIMIEDKNEITHAYENDEQIDNKSEKIRKKVKSKNNEDQLKVEDYTVLKAELDKIKMENEELKKKLDDEHNNMLRVAADYENLKKRLYKDLEYKVKFANSELIKNLLPVIDHLEMAMQHTKEQSDIQALYEGVNLTLNQLKNILEKFGLKDIEIGNNESFDPSYHEAMMLENHEDKDNNVITKVLQKGYILHDTVIRPVKVAVNKKVNHKKEE
jgi:molecular chaperone GrpE